jgi:large subunit ribosomal protein L5
MRPRLREIYDKEVRARLRERLGTQNDMALPKLEKITVSAGVGKAKENKKLLSDAVEVLTRATGQKAVITKARKPIAQFKLRAGMPVGAMVTLRGDMAYEFLDRLISVVIPRIRDFRGLSRTFDAQGNYNMGLQEQSVFPEIEGDLLENQQGMNIAITIRNAAGGAGGVLLEEFGFPFKREEVSVG